jgi:hypothetical protein
MKTWNISLNFQPMSFDCCKYILFIDSYLYVLSKRFGGQTNSGYKKHVIDFKKGPEVAASERTPYVQTYAERREARIKRFVPFFLISLVLLDCIDEILFNI